MIVYMSDKFSPTCQPQDDSWEIKSKYDLCKLLLHQQVTPAQIRLIEPAHELQLPVDRFP